MKCVIIFGELIFIFYGYDNEFHFGRLPMTCKILTSLVGVNDEKNGSENIV